jgi:hypothetical protein
MVPNEATNIENDKQNTGIHLNPPTLTSINSKKEYPPKTKNDNEVRIKDIKSSTLLPYRSIYLMPSREPINWTLATMMLDVAALKLDPDFSKVDCV